MQELNGNTHPPSLDLSLEQVHERILKLVEQGHRNGHQIGRIYNYVVDSELAQKGGFKDAQDFFKQRVQVVSQAVLSLNGAVARAFSEEVAVKYGMRNLYTLLAYAKQEGVTVAESDPGALPVAVPQQDGTVLSKPFADCSVEELQRAMKHKRSPSKPLPEQDTARVQHYRDNLQRHFTERLSIRVDARNHLGELLITLRDIPEKEMRRLAAALVDEPVTATVASGVKEPARNDVSDAPAPTVTPAQGAAHNDNTPVLTRPATQTVANDGDSVSNVPVARATPVGAAPVSEGRSTAGVIPLQPPLVPQGHIAPRNKEQGLGGFLRRITGG